MDGNLRPLRLRQGHRRGLYRFGGVRRVEMGRGEALHFFGDGEINSIQSLSASPGDERMLGG